MVILVKMTTLIGYETKGVNNSNIPLKVWKKTNEGGYGCVYFSVLYLFNTDNAVVSDLNIVGKAPGYNSNTVGTTTDEYKTTSIYSESNKNITITNCDVKGSSWGILENKYCCHYKFHLHFADFDMQNLRFQHNIQK